MISRIVWLAVEFDQRTVWGALELDQRNSMWNSEDRSMGTVNKDHRADVESVKIDHTDIVGEVNMGEGRGIGQ